jgi:hypothetical protein
MIHPKRDELVNEARRLAYGVKTVSECEAAAKRLVEIIRELRGDEEAIVQVRGYGQMIAQTGLALEAMQSDDT